MKRSTAHRERRRLARTKLARHDREEKFVGGPSSKRARKKYPGGIQASQPTKQPAPASTKAQRAEFLRVNSRRPLTQRIALPAAIRAMGTPKCSLTRCANDPAFMGWPARFHLFATPPAPTPEHP